MAREVDPVASRLRVEVAAWDPDFYGGNPFDWGERDDLSALVKLRSGMIPSECRIWGGRDPTESDTPYHRPLYREASTTRINPGQDGAMVSPLGLGAWDFVRVVKDGWAPPVFLGVVTGWAWNRRTCRLEAVAQDYRVLLNRITCRGSRHNRPAAGDDVFLADLGPHFNAEGHADQFKPAVGPAEMLFCPSDGSDTGVWSAYFWTVGMALNCLRDLFFTSHSPALGLDTVEKFLEWPEASATDKWPWLFVDPDSGDDYRVLDLDCGGKKLGWAIDNVLAAAGAVNWTLEYRANDKARIKVFQTYSTEASGSLSLGRSGGKLQDDPPDVYDGDLDVDFSRSYPKVRAVGARKRVDLSLTLIEASPNVAPNTDAASDLVPLWNATQQAALLALDEDSPERNSQAYQDVFCSFGAPEGVAWDTWLSANYREGPRKALPLLASFMRAEPEATGQPIQVPARIWRYKGGTWEALPSSIGFVLLSDRVGFRLAGTARQELVREPGGDPETWSWYLDGATPKLYPLRITLCLESDERLVDTATDADLASWPAGELYLAAGARYRYDKRRGCWLRWDGAAPVVNGGSDHQFGSAGDDVIQDSSDELAALADRKLKVVGCPEIRGGLTVVGLRPDLVPGYIVGQLADSGDRPSLDLFRAIQAVEYDDRQQVTRVSFGG